MNNFLIILGCLVGALVLWQVYLLYTADGRFQKMIREVIREHNARVLECHLTEQQPRWYLPTRTFLYAVRYQESDGPEHLSVWKGTIVFLRVAVECTEDNPIGPIPIH
ncbi:MAG: hypothetical protein ACFCD0_27055 [Gemmataceae bacterium]